MKRVRESIQVKNNRASPSLSPLLFPVVKHYFEPGSVSSSCSAVGTAAVATARPKGWRGCSALQGGGITLRTKELSWDQLQTAGCMCVGNGKKGEKVRGGVMCCL